MYEVEKALFEIYKDPKLYTKPKELRNAAAHITATPPVNASTLYTMIKKYIW